jgi:hypothetical protein
MKDIPQWSEHIRPVAANVAFGESAIFLKYPDRDAGVDIKRVYQRVFVHTERYHKKLLFSAQDQILVDS